MAEFEVTGPFELPITMMATGAKHLNEKDAKQMVAGIDDFQSRGCYVISARSPNGHTPIYVGKAGKRELGKECLIARNVGFINEAINEKKRRFPCIFLVRQLKGKGPWNENEIAQVEEYLIANAATKNPNLKNRQLLPKEKWRIKGIVKAKKGEANGASSALRKALNIR